MAFINQVMEKIMQGVGSLFWKQAPVDAGCKTTRKSTDPKSILKLRRTQSLKKVSFGPDQIIYRYNSSPEKDLASEPNKEIQKQQQKPQSEPTKSNDPPQQPKDPPPKLELLPQPPPQPQLSIQNIAPVVNPLITIPQTPQRSTKKITIKLKSAKSIRVSKRDTMEQDKLKSIRREFLEEDCVFCGEPFSDARLVCAHTAHIGCFYKRGTVLCRACESKNML